MPLEVLLKSLELLDADPASFFGHALAAKVDPADFLREAAEAARGDRAADDLLAAAHDAASALASPAAMADDTMLPGEPTTADRDLARQLAECSLAESRRRLRATRKYRTVGFTQACLADLSARRAREPLAVAKIAATIASDLVPALDASPEVRLVLIVRAAIEYASARRMVQDHAGAAAVVRPLVMLARRHGMRRLCGELWRLGARILLHRNQPQRALELFDQAVLCFADFGLSLDLVSLQIDRAILFERCGDLDSTERCLEVALRDLDHLSALGLARPDAMRLAQVSAHSMSAELAIQQKKLDRALEHAQAAAEGLAESGGVRWAQAQWKIAEIAMADERYGHEVETRLETARDEFAAIGDSNAILVVLDLTRLKLKQGRVAEAVEDARGMAAFLSQRRGEPVLDDALAGFVRTALEGELTLRFVDSFRASFAQALHKARSATRSGGSR
ncbi:MAG: hypothetical protein AAGC60_06590 [Acidobacteriota bacterium]